MSPDPVPTLREQLVSLLGEGHAHATFDQAVAGLAEDFYGRRPPGLDLTPWRLLEHLRIAQWDILQFSRNSRHQSPKWPDGYWPPSDAPPTADAWKRSVSAFQRDLEAMQKLVADHGTELFARIPWGTGQTILREALLLADHNAYHVGQMVTLRKLLGAWKG